MEDDKPVGAGQGGEAEAVGGETGDLAQSEAGGSRRERGIRVVALGLGGNFGALGGDLGGGDGFALVAPGVADVGENGGDLVVVESELTGHDIVVVDAVDLDRAGKALENDADAALFVRHEVVGFRERREYAGDTLAGGVVADGAVELVEGGAIGRGGGSRGGEKRWQGKDKRGEEYGETHGREKERTGGGSGQIFFPGGAWG